MALIRHNEISFLLPPDWEDKSQIVVCALSEGDFSPNVVVAFDFPDVDETAEHFARRQLPSLQQTLDHLVVVEERPATFGRLSGYLLEYQFFIQNTRLKQLYFTVLVASKAYIFIYSDLADRFELQRKLGEQIFSQIRIAPLDDADA